MRLISLRGPREGLSVDLAPLVPDSEVLRSMQGNLGLLGQPELVKRVVSQVRQLDEFEVTQTWLNGLRETLEGAHRLRGLTVDVGGPSHVPLEDAPHSLAFREGLQSVYDSWLAQRITAGGPASIEAHVRLLRAAAVVLAWADPTDQVGVGRFADWLDATVIVTPRVWTDRAQAQTSASARRALNPNAPERSRNLRASDLRSKLSTVTTAVEAMRKVDDAVLEAQSRWARSQVVIVEDSSERHEVPQPGLTVRPQPGSGPGVAREARASGAGLPPPFTEDQIRRTLTQKLKVIGGIPAGIRDEMNKIIDRPSSMNEFFGDLGVVVAGDDSQLCAEIQAIESAILTDLPPAPSPTRPDHPPLISTLGLGDLVVARERLLGYEANEIAHIENVLPGEAKKVENEQLHRFEVATELETTTEEESQSATDTTDRNSEQNQTQTAMERSLAVDAGVNVSSKYGATKIDASLDVQFRASRSESTSQTTDAAHEIITKTVERSREEVRNLRRTLTIDETRSLTQHDIDNTADGVGGSPDPISGVYRWVDKVVEIELRRYGTRLMVEFHIPEPAVSILESQERTEARTRSSLPPFDVSPADLNRQTYLCLAQRYDADLVPPPAERIDVPFHHASEVTEEKDVSGEHVSTGLINVPSEYRPLSVTVTVTAPPDFARSGWAKPYITVAVGNALTNYARKTPDGTVVEEYSGPVIASLWPAFGASGFVTSSAHFEPSVPVEQGVPISMSATGAYDNAFTAHAVISAKLTDQAWQAWQLESWRRLRQAHAHRADELERDERERDIAKSFGIETTERPSSVNRRTERTELTKWAIKAMRHETFDFHPIVTEEGLQEIDPNDAHAQAPVTAFFEQSFEWSQMTYFFYPYYWARRDTWEMRKRQQSVDATYEAFLQSGAARVIVPVTPGYERRLLCYLNFQDSELATQIPGMDTPCPGDPLEPGHDTATPDFYDVGLDILTERHGELILGTGSLSIVHGETQITINPDSLWIADGRDIGRELQIAGIDYEINDVASETTLILDRPILTETDPIAPYVAGSMRYGSPWQVRVPTALTVLVEEAVT